jgi:organic radical activating enzyme
MTDENNRRGDVVKLENGKYKTAYFENSKELLGGLNSVSKSFCLAKWFNVSVHIPTGRTQSCYHPPTHKVPLNELSVSSDALHNTNYKKEQRKKMLSGERPSECSFCWDIEDAGNISDRAYRSFDVYTPTAIEEALSVGFEGNPAPKYLEVNFNQACNLKCSYCSPHLSTEWHKEVKELGPYRLHDRTHNDDSWMKESGWVPDNSPDNPYLTAFWDWFPTVYYNLKTFRMTGGEPLMDRNTFKIFDHVKKNPNKNLHLSITSNCCPPKGQWQKFIDDLKEITDQDAIDHFMLFCSLDSWGPQAEYIRNGMDFPTLLKNIRQYLSESSKHSLTFIVTANLLSLPNWLTYIKNIHQLMHEMNTDRQLIWFDTPMLTDPRWMSMKLASKEMLQPLLDSIEYMEEHREGPDNRFHGFKDFQIQKVKRLYDWAVVPLDPVEEAMAKKNFYKYFTEHDRRRNTNLRETFPELKHFIDECEELSNV